MSIETTVHGLDFRLVSGTGNCMVGRVFGLDTDVPLTLLDAAKRRFVCGAYEPEQGLKESHPPCLSHSS